MRLALDQLHWPTTCDPPRAYPACVFFSACWACDRLGLIWPPTPFVVRPVGPTGLNVDVAKQFHVLVDALQWLMRWSGKTVKARDVCKGVAASAPRPSPTTYEAAHLQPAAGAPCDFLAGPAVHLIATG